MIYMKITYRRICVLSALSCLIATFFLTGCPRNTRNTSGSPSRSSQRSEASPSTQTVSTIASTAEELRRLTPPPRGRLYHGFHPGGKGGEEDAVLTDPRLLDSYVSVAGHQPAFVYFSHEWGHQRKRRDDIEAHAFPLDQI